MAVRHCTHACPTLRAGDYLSLKQLAGHGFISDRNWDAANAACGSWNVSTPACNNAMSAASNDVGDNIDVYDICEALIRSAVLMYCVQRSGSFPRLNAGLGWRDAVMKDVSLPDTFAKHMHHPLLLTRACSSLHPGARCAQIAGFGEGTCTHKIVSLC